MFVRRTDAEAEAPILCPPDAKSRLAKDPGKKRCWERLKAGEGVTEDEMVGWHHRPNGHEFEQTLGDGEGQGGLRAAVPGVAETDHVVIIL